VEKVIVSTQQIPKKGQPTQQEEKAALSLQQNREDTVADKNLHKKQRKFQTPLPKVLYVLFLNDQNSHASR